MKYLITLFAVLLCLPVLGQLTRKAEIERFTSKAHSAKEFRQIVDSLELSVDELSDYPIIFPIKNPVISSGFGMRKHPVHKVRKFHTGIDMPKAKGAPVYATSNGVVSRKGYCSVYGYFIEVQHAGGFRSFYAHLNKTMVNVGDLVEIAQQIACVGNTGVSTGSHLHYEVRKENYFLNLKEWCYLLYEILKNN
jgi:murein DD-endopeptidase MepM/ murein hydrolase activator NlpD